MGRRASLSEIFSGGLGFWSPAQAVLLPRQPLPFLMDQFRSHPQHSYFSSVWCTSVSVGQFPLSVVRSLKNVTWVCHWETEQAAHMARDQRADLEGGDGTGPGQDVHRVFGVLWTSPLLTAPSR